MSLKHEDVGYNLCISISSGFDEEKNDVNGPVINDVSSMSVLSIEMEEKFPYKTVAVTEEYRVTSEVCYRYHLSIL